MPDYLILQLARMGDLIQSKRLLLSLPGRVHLALDQGLVGLAARLFPQAMPHPLHAHARGQRPADVLADNARAFSALAEIDFRAVYNLNRSPLSLALAGLFPPEKVIGHRLDNGQALSSTWCRMAGRWTAERPASPLNLADFWAFFHPAPLAPALVNPPARAKNEPGRQKIGVTLAGRAARRSLPPEYLARALEAVFAARKGPEIILLGDRSEEEAARKVMKFLKPATRQRVRDLSGKTGPDDLYDLIGGLDLLFTPDTGLMHLAAHLGTPVMAVFLSSAWAWETGPYGLGHKVWQAARSCAPCLESSPCPRKTACLAPFAAPEWLAALAARPERGAAGPPPGLLELDSGLDDLGAVYEAAGPANSDPAAARRVWQRARQRALLREYLLPSPAGENPAGPPGAGAGADAALLHERDWMLPDYA